MILPFLVVTSFGDVLIFKVVTSFGKELISWDETSIGDVLLIWVANLFRDVLLSWAVIFFGDVLRYWVVTSFDVVSDIVVGLTIIDPLPSQDLPENLHVLHEPGPGIFFSDRRHCAVVKEES